MRRLAEATAFVGLSAALHAAVWTYAPTGTGTGAGAGGAASVSLSASSPAIAALVDSWDRAPTVATPASLQTMPETAPAASVPAPDTPLQGASAPALSDPATPGAAPRPPMAMRAPATMEGPGPALSLPRAEVPVALPMPDRAPPRPGPERLGPVATPVAPPADAPQQAAQVLAAAPGEGSDTQPPAPLEPVVPRAIVPDLTPPPLTPAPQVDAATPPPPVPDQAALTSPRPVMRPDRPEPQPARTPPRATDTAPASPGQVAAGSGQREVQGAGGQAQTASLSPGQRQSLMAAWAARIHARIERRRPGVAGQGTVTLRIAVARDGALQSVAIARSSGDAALDRAGISAVQRAGGFAAAPEGLRDPIYRFDVPIRFR